MNLRASLGPLALLAFVVAGCGGASAPLAPRSDRAVSLAAPSAAATDAPPVVSIVSPVPSPFLDHIFQFDQPATIQWAATDPDGPGPGVHDFRYLLIDNRPRAGDDYLIARVNPDSIIRRDAPGFTNWTQVAGSVDHVTFTGLDPTNRYVLMVTAFDRRHAFDRVFTLTKNVLQFSFGNLGAPGN